MCVGGGACSRVRSGRGRRASSLCICQLMFGDIEGTRIPIKFGMNRNMFSYAPSFSTCAGGTAVPLPLARVCTDAMVVGMTSSPSSQ
jgi:hypothetical protein